MNVKSDLLIPGLKSSEEMNDVDLIIHYGRVVFNKNHLEERVLSKYSRVIHSKTGELCLLWNDIYICSILHGKEIIVNPQTGLDQNFLLSLIFGYGIAILFHQRGFFVLHANAVEMDGGAVLFLGANGVGKSTTTANLVKKGYKLLSDDMLVLQIKDNDIPLVFPGLQQIKLWPEVIINLDENPEKMPKISSKSEKRYYRFIDNFSNDPKHIKAIYLIEEGKKTFVKDLGPQKSLMGLIKGSYCLGLFDEMELYENFKECSKIANTVPIRSLIIKYSFEKIPNLVEIIEKDVRDI